MENLISVIVPVYNVEKYLSKCIQSIINQTYKNLEIILIDDGSQDNSSKLCDEYSLKDSRISVIHKKNGGLSSARNVGLSNANGDYITFIDSDDWIDQNMISTLFNIINQEKSDIAVCNYFLAYNEEIQIQKDKIEIKNFSNIEALKKLYDEKLKIVMTIACCKLFKRELFNNINFPDGRIHEDEFTTYKLLYKAEKISYTNKKFYYYRQRKDSIMNSAFNKKKLDIIYALEERIKFIKESVNDMELYNLVVKGYYITILRRYYLYSKSCPNEKRELKELKKRARETYKKNKNSFDWNLKLRLIYTSFLISPKLYILIEDISKLKNNFRQVN
ncbi:MAG: glycosyltransferase family 2 protein [Clostridium sp.]